MQKACTIPNLPIELWQKIAEFNRSNLLGLRSLLMLCKDTNQLALVALWADLCDLGSALTKPLSISS